METRNVLLAVILSSAVLFFWAIFFDQPIAEQQTYEKQLSENETLSSPSIDESEQKVKNSVTRDDVINSTKRIKIENESIKIHGSCHCSYGFYCCCRHHNRI